MAVEVSRGRVKKVSLPIRTYDVTIASLRHKDIQSGSIDYLLSVVDKYFENAVEHLD